MTLLKTFVQLHESAIVSYCSYYLFICRTVNETSDSFPLNLGQGSFSILIHIATFSSLGFLLAEEVLQIPIFLSLEWCAQTYDLANWCWLSSEQQITISRHHLFSYLVYVIHEFSFWSQSAHHRYFVCWISYCGVVDQVWLLW